jgi:hypothetical protein
MPTKPLPANSSSTSREPFAELRMPPVGIGVFAATWWRDVQTTFAISDAEGLTALRLAAIALDRGERCRLAIQRDGEVTQGRDGQPRVHPLIAAERDARAGALAALRRLDIGLVPAARPGRPGGLP